VSEGSWQKDLALRFGLGPETELSNPDALKKSSSIGSWPREGCSIDRVRPHPPQRPGEYTCNVNQLGVSHACRLDTGRSSSWLPHTDTSPGRAKRQPCCGRGRELETASRSITSASHGRSSWTSGVVVDREALAGSSSTGTSRCIQRAIEDQGAGVRKVGKRNPPARS